MTFVYVPPPPPPPGPFGSKGFVWIVAAVIIAGVCFFGGFNPFAGMSSGSEVKTPGGNSQAALLKVAVQFDKLGYKWGGGHDPKTWYANYKKGSKDGLDCSGLVDVAVYIITDGKISSDQVAEGFRDDKHWETIGTRHNGKTDLSQARAGDIVWRIPPHGGSIGHVAIVVDNNPGAKRVTVFEAYSSHPTYSNQIRESTYAYNDLDGASRFKG